MNLPKKGGRIMKRTHLASLLFGAALFIAGCATTAQQGCMDELKSRYPNYTKEERLVLFYGAKGVGCIHEWFLEIEKKDKDAPGVPKVAYHKVKLDKMLAVERKQLADAADILDTSPKNISTYKLLEELGLRPYFEAMERAGKFRVARLDLKLNYDEFRKLLGEIDVSSVAEDKRKGYSVQIFLPIFDQVKEAPFSAKYLEEAKREGKLIFIGMTTVFDYESLGKKEPHPEYIFDPNQFVWKEKVEGLEVRLYKVINSERPRDKQPHYLEATRLTHRFDKSGAIISTERESKPALRIFASPNDTLDIVVLDSDREGELGFGLPDVIEKLTYGITTGKELYINHQTLLQKLFVEKVADKRKPLPKPDPQKLEVAKAGTPVDPWEKALSSQGWSIPHEYKSEKKDNYSIEIILKRRKPGDDTSQRQIDFVAKVYHSAANSWMPVKGEVVEYYRPLPDYAEKNVLEARVDWSNKKKVTVEREGQPSVSGIINPGKNSFIEERPVAIDFSDGETRWRIADKDKSGVYMYRMEISKSGSNGGESEGDSGSSGSSPYSGSPGPH